MLSLTPTIRILLAIFLLTVPILALTLPDSLQPAGTAWTPTEARALCVWMLKNAQFSEQEKALVIQLAQPSPVKLTFEDGRTVTMEPAVGGALDNFRMLTEKADLGALWDGDSASFDRLMDYYTLGPMFETAIQKVAVKRLFSFWNRSSVNNSYEPIRKEIGRVWDLSAGKPYETEARALLYDSCKRIDNYLDGAIPNYIYDGLRVEAKGRKRD